MELTTVTPDVAGLRALSHPTGCGCWACCGPTGPRRRRRLAARLGINTGQTSYHLRQLAQHGFVVDDLERGNGRERWWRRRTSRR